MGCGRYDPYGRHQCVYFVLCPAAGLIKIGTTCEHPDKRLDGLRRGSPFPLEPLGILRGGQSRERKLHVRFRPLRTHGEWFRAEPNLTDFIAKCAKPWPSLDEEYWLPDPEKEQIRWDYPVNQLIRDAIHIHCVRNGWRPTPEEPELVIEPYEWHSILEGDGL